MIRTFSRISLCIAFLNTFLFQIAITQNNILTYFPVSSELRGWNQQDSTRVFVGEDLYTLIDGGADIYLEYGFRQAAAAEYRNDRENSIKLEIYEMSDASAAYGMFSLNAGTQGKKIQIGNEGMLFQYYLMFWKNKFIIFLTGNDTTSETISGILEIAASIDKRLSAPGTKPTLVSRLSSNNLKSCTYVRGTIALSSFYTFDTKNIFRVKEGVVGKYPTYTLLIFQYASDKEAEENYKSAQEVQKNSSRYFNFKEHTGRYTITDKKDTHLCIAYSKNLIVVVLSMQKKNVLAICDDVISSLQRR
jgi:hypothetical protein